MKRSLSHYQYHFLENELKVLEENGKLHEGQSVELMTNYEIQQYVVPEKKRTNPMYILLVIGAVLIGLSLLSFVASNWSGMSQVSKFILLFVLLVGFYLAGYTLEKKKRVLSRVLYYIGAFAYCAEVIYIGQMFHLGGEIQSGFLCWGLGILPLGFYLKDLVLKLIGLLLIYVFIHIQFMYIETNLAYIMLVIIPLMFAFGYFVMNRSIILLIVNFLILYEFIQLHVMIKPLEMDRFPFELLVVVPLMFYIGHHVMKKSMPLFIANLVLSLQAVGMAIGYYGEDYGFIIAALVFFGIGMLMTYIQHVDYKIPMYCAGISLHVIAGVILTFSDVWSNLMNNMAGPAAFGFSIIYVLYNLYYVKRGKLQNVAIICALILRFYVDLSLGFMNKSIAFLVGGILFIGLGYWIERTRKNSKKGVIKHEKE